MWSRMRSRIAGLFSRKTDTDAETDSDSDTDVGFDTETETETESDEVQSDADVSRIVDEQPAESPASLAAVAPPEDFKFPWTRPEGEPGLEQVPEPMPASESAPTAFDAHDEQLAAATPDAARPGFFARLFGRKSKELSQELALSPEVEVEVERGAEIETEASVSESIELAPPVMEVESAEAEETEAELEVPAMRAESPSVDLPTFESSRELPAIQPLESFESVDEALPISEEPPAGEEMAPPGEAKPR